MMAAEGNGMPRTITDIEYVEFDYPLEDVVRDDASGKLCYLPGSVHERTTYALKVGTDSGVTGEYVGGTAPGIAQIESVAGALLGENPLERERLWNQLSQSLRMFDGVGIGPVDIALWDIAGKRAGMPIHELLGTHRTRLPAYASTYFASPDAGFACPEAFAEFAETCRNLGYQAFKIHPWTNVGKDDLDREKAALRAVGSRVGGEMDLMHDPVCAYETFGDALAVGRICDEQGFYWYEDPYQDGGVSQHGHRKLREALDTPLLQTELVRGLHAHADFIAGDATDFVRADVEWDGGITGAIKIARVAEAFGLDVEYHLPGPAQRHCMAATRNSNYYEIGLVHPTTDVPHTEPPVYAGGYTDALETIDTDGTFPIPDGVGLGVDYDWEFIRDHQSRTRRFE